jgi:hypothetical protein
MPSTEVGYRVEVRNGSLNLKGLTLESAGKITLPLNQNIEFGGATSRIWADLSTGEIKFQDPVNGTLNLGTLAGAGGDHGLLSGLLDDDHTQYSLADGTRAFTGAVSGVAPTASAHLTTKNYVDTGLGTKAATGHDHNLVYSRLDGTTAYTGAVPGVTPTLNAHLTTKLYVDTQVATKAATGHNHDATYVKIDGTTAFTAPVSGSDPTLSSHLATKNYVDLQGISDHGALTGLGDDDHTQYSLASGTRAFTGVVVGVTPTLATHLATKGYVDGAVISDHGALGGLLDDDHTQYSLVNGTRAYTAEVAGVTPTSSVHLATKGYVDASVSAVSGFYADPVADVTALKAVLQSARVDKQIRLVEGVGFIYRFDLGATVGGETPDDVDDGRWYQISSAAASDHEALTGLLGGAASDHYHITAVQHSGLTGGSATALHTHDHGALDGLGDDDHTIYTKADGTRAFTGAVLGITPTAAAHLATKGYVDGAVISDHGALGGLVDDDHTQYSLADGTRDFTGVVVGVTPTLAAHLATKGYVDGVAGTTDHGALTGLGDDDHTQYSLADGTRDFTGVVAGVTPTLAAHLATKGYVDGEVISDHGALTGLGDDDHTQYLLADGTRNLSSHLTFDGLGTDPGASAPDKANLYFDTVADRLKISQNGGGFEDVAVASDIPSVITDHGALTGLGDDDHTQYSLADGTRDFTGVVVGITPTLDAHLATKGYVDGAAGTTDHGALTGLGDDDHTQYVLVNGTRVMTGSLSVETTIPSVGLVGASASAAGPQANFKRSKGSIASPTIVADGNFVGALNFQAYDGSSFLTSAQVIAQIDGAPGASDVPTRLDFYTGNSTPSPRRLSVQADGALTWIEQAAPALSVAGDARIYLDSTSKTLKVSEDGGAYQDLVGGGGTTDHGALTGLGDDDHTQYVLADGTRSFTGDVQRSPDASHSSSDVVMYATTTDDTPTPLAGGPTLASGDTWGYEIILVGRDAGGGDSAMYKYLLMGENVGGTSAQVGSTTSQEIEDVAAWVVTVTIDDTTDKLKIVVTGTAATTIKWTADVRGVRVGA